MLDGHREELSHRLHSVEQAGRLRGHDADPARRRVELVTLGAEVAARRVEVQRDARIAYGGACRHSLGNRSGAIRDQTRSERTDRVDLGVRVAVDVDDGARRDEKAVAW